MLRLAEDDAGFTLVELLIVVVILGFVGGITVTGIVQGMRTSDRVEARVQTFTDLQRVSERVSRDLRRGVWTDTADASSPVPDGCTFISLDPDDVTLIVFTDGERFKHRYTLAADELSVDIDVWDAGTDSWDDVSSSIIIDGLVNGSTGTDLFRYLDDAGVDLLLNGFQSEDRLAVRKFELTLVGDVPNQDPVEVVTVVSARNGGFPCPVA